MFSISSSSSPFAHFSAGNRILESSPRAHRKVTGREHANEQNHILGCKLI